MIYVYNIFCTEVRTVGFLPPPTLKFLECIHTYIQYIHTYIRTVQYNKWTEARVPERPPFPTRSDPRETMLLVCLTTALCLTCTYYDDDLPKGTVQGSRRTIWVWPEVVYEGRIYHMGIPLTITVFPSSFPFCVSDSRMIMRDKLMVSVGYREICRC